jgi:carbon monoxide dehydrogenase subunit G
MAMTMSGEYQIAAPRQVVWEKLNDPEVLKACIPGCEQLEKISETEFQAVAVNRIGPVKAKFKGKVRLSDIDPPNGYRISGEGDGGVAGFAKGGATVTLLPKDDGTLLTYNVEAQIGGKLAQIGQRLVNGVAKKMADEFFEKFSKMVTATPG